MFSKVLNKEVDKSMIIKLSAIDNSSNVSISLNEPSAIYKNWINSFFDLLAAPSAIFVGTDTAALLSCDTNPNFSSEGNELVIRYTSLTRLKLCFQASRFLCGLINKFYSKDRKTVYCSLLTAHQKIN